MQLFFNGALSFHDGCKRIWNAHDYSFLGIGRKGWRIDKKKKKKKGEKALESNEEGRPSFQLREDIVKERRMVGARTPLSVENNKSLHWRNFRCLEWKVKGELSVSWSGKDSKISFFLPFPLFRFGNNNFCWFLILQMWENAAFLKKKKKCVLTRYLFLGERIIRVFCF